MNSWTYRCSIHAKILTQHIHVCIWMVVTGSLKLRTLTVWHSHLYLCVLHEFLDVPLLYPCKNAYTTHTCLHLDGRHRQPQAKVTAGLVLARVSMCVGFQQDMIIFVTITLAQK